MASGKPTRVSSKLMGLKFMQRAQAKEDLRKKKEEQQKAQHEEKFVLENKKKGCVVLQDDFVMQSSGRISFMNYNPEVDALNQEHQARVKQSEIDTAERDDVSAKEMAQVLGKRKQLPADRVPAAEKNSIASKDPSQPNPSKSPKTNQHRKQAAQEPKINCNFQDGEGSIGREHREQGRKAPKGGKDAKPRGKEMPSGTSLSESASLRAAPGVS